MRLIGISKALFSIIFYYNCHFEQNLFIRKTFSSLLFWLVENYVETVQNS